MDKGGKIFVCLGKNILTRGNSINVFDGEKFIQ